MEVFERPVPIDKEVSWDKTKTIMSKTDRFGTIEYANEVFIDVSGYEDYEIDVSAAQHYPPSGNA